MKLEDIELQLKKLYPSLNFSFTDYKYHKSQDGRKVMDILINSGKEWESTSAHVIQTLLFVDSTNDAIPYNTDINEEISALKFYDLICLFVARYKMQNQNNPEPYKDYIVSFCGYPCGNANPSFGCNMDIKLRTGGRKAPKGGKSYLTIQRILKALSEDYDPTDLPEDYENLAYYICGEHKDFKYNVDFENCYFEKEGTTSSGVDYLAFSHGGDWEMPAAFYVYWDGKKIRVYEPLKGNMINTITNSAFGNGDDYNPNSDDQYCIKEFGLLFEECYDKGLMINWDACLEDFEARLEVV